MLIYQHLGAYHPNVHERNMKKPLTDAHASRCLLCCAPVARRSGVRVHVVEGREDMGDGALVTAEELEAVPTYSLGLQAIGPDCFRREREALAPYVIEGPQRGRPRIHAEGKRAQNPERSRGPVATTQDAELLARVPKRQLSAVARSLAPNLQRSAAAVRTALDAAQTAGQGRSLPASLRAALSLYLDEHDL